MTNEIKEIRDYIACPQLGDDYYGEWGALRLDQRLKIKKLLDYITNLQEENERLNKQYDLMEQSLDEKQEVIDKAVEYCNNNIEFTPRLIDVIDILRGDE